MACYITSLLHSRASLYQTIQASYVSLPPAVLESWERKMSHMSSPIRPNHLLNWLWTSAQLSRFTGYLCICELLHRLWTPAVCMCVPPQPCLSVSKSVCGPLLYKTGVSLTLLLIYSQHSGGGLGPVEEELGWRSWGSPKVLLQGNSSGFSPPL